MGKISIVDLSKRQISEMKIEDSYCRDYLGGYGFGVKVLFDELKPGTDPLGPENILGFITGPLTGTGALIAPRFMVVGKSPLTGGWGEANCGGYFGTILKRAGYDGIFVKGRAEMPVYILIDEGNVEIKEAAFLWGKDTFETEDLLRSMYGFEARVLSIGPAGEMGSLISAMITEKGNAAARSGLAAVMGSKNLKALVVKGSQEIPVFDPMALKEAREKYMPQLKEGFAKLLTDYGTAGCFEGAVECGDAPVKNWSGVGTVDFPRSEKIGGDALRAIREKKVGCFKCPVACGSLVKTENKDGTPNLVRTVQYETLAAFGSMCLNDSLESVVKCNEICNRYGLDTISAGAVAAFAIECFENGLLSLQDVDGLQLNWGNGEAIVTLTEKIARREGIGAMLADGCKLTAEKLGGNAMEYAMQIGGQELPMHDPRLYPGLLTTYISDPTPARHTQGSEVYVPPGLDVPYYDKTKLEGRGEAHKLLADLNHVIDCAGLCLFGYFCLDIKSAEDFINAVTGWDTSMEELLVAGERISQLRHAFNLREGIHFRDYFIPKRLLGIPPLPGGPTEGVTLDAQLLLKDYTTAMSWDEETLLPHPERLSALDLKYVTEELKKEGDKWQGQIGKR
jgi:aldehyde:ferredoxin oxidoreductase